MGEPQPSAAGNQEQAQVSLSRSESLANRMQRSPWLAVFPIAAPDEAGRLDPGIREPIERLLQKAGVSAP